MRGDEGIVGYLARMDRHEHVGIDFESGRRQDETERFLPLKLIASDADVFATVNAICDLVLHQFDDASVLVPAMEWAVNGIVDNIDSGRRRGTSIYRDESGSTCTPRGGARVAPLALVSSNTSIGYKSATRTPAAPPDGAARW
jgi:hypothetical protein